VPLVQPPPDPRLLFDESARAALAEAYALLGRIAERHRRRVAVIAPNTPQPIATDRNRDRRRRRQSRGLTTRKSPPVAALASERR
jgi:hypothetical protein